MKKLLDMYLHINSILEESGIEIVSTSNPFGPGVTLVDKNSGQALTISERSGNHMHKPIGKTEVKVEEKKQTKTLIEQYQEEKSPVLLNKLVAHFEPVQRYVVEQILETTKNPGTKLFLNMRAEKELPVIISEYNGDNSFLEKYVTIELKSRLEVASQKKNLLKKISMNKEGVSKHDKGNTHPYERRGKTFGGDFN